MSEEQKNTGNSLNFTVKNVLRILSFLAIIFVFCPSFLVSCSGQQREVGVMNLVKGISTPGGQQLESPHPTMLICLFIPATIFVLLLANKLKEKILSMIIAATTVVDLIVWIIFKMKISEASKNFYCSFETTPWYHLNVIALASMILLSVAVIINKLHMETNMIGAFSNAGTTVNNITVNNVVQTETTTSEARSSVTTQANPMDVKTIVDKENNE